MNLVDKKKYARHFSWRLIKNRLYQGVFVVFTGLALLALALLLYRIFTQGIGYLNWDFLTSYASRKPSEAGIKSAFVGTIWLMIVTTPLAFIFGVGTAIYLEEYGNCTKRINRPFFPY
ncbi:MAG TPA: phosphate ABC transporter, permease protein PstA, partial [Bacilli bacterium]|nr:phosphate ABC transporter, permease protein PstA [Bacilli bacterium]